MSTFEPFLNHEFAIDFETDSNSILRNNVVIFEYDLINNQCFLRISFRDNVDKDFMPLIEELMHKKQIITIRQIDKTNKAARTIKFDDCIATKITHSGFNYANVSYNTVDVQIISHSKRIIT